MHFKIAVILVIAGISCVYTESCDEDKTEIYYKGLKVTDTECLCKQNLCLTKCCPFGTGYDVEDHKCVDIAHTFNPPVKDEYLRTQSEDAIDLFYFKFNIIQCDGIRVRSSDLYGFHVRTDGNLYIQVPNSIPPFTLMGPDTYCIDNFVTESDDGNKTTAVDALVCFPSQPDTNDYVFSAICMIVSCGFILITVAVYLWLPKLHNVHGRVLVAYLMCLFVGFLFMATMQLLLHNDKMQKKSCQAMTFIIYFSLLSAFFWLNVMCFDIWRVFSGKREIRPQKLLVWSQIRTYSVYAFGIPTILTILLISLEYSGLPPSLGMPMIQQQGCFLSGYSKLIYLYGPMLVLCVANIVLFILTAIKIAKTRKETSVLSSGDSSRHDQQNDKQTLFLYVKLFIVMGINWILEVVSALYPHALWRYTDAYNVLIGLVIFIIFVCKRQIIHLLKERIKERFQQSRRRELRSTIRVNLNDIKHRPSQDTIRSNITGDSDIGKGPYFTNVQSCDTRPCIPESHDMVPYHLHERRGGSQELLDPNLPRHDFI